MVVYKETVLSVPPAVAAGGALIKDVTNENATRRYR
jgi:hypothetical protein